MNHLVKDHKKKETLQSLKKRTAKIKWKSCKTAKLLKLCLLQERLTLQRSMLRSRPAWIHSVSCLATMPMEKSSLKKMVASILIKHCRCLAVAFCMPFMAKEVSRLVHWQTQKRSFRSHQKARRVKLTLLIWYLQASHQPSLGLSKRHGHSSSQRQASKRLRLLPPDHIPVRLKNCTHTVKSSFRAKSSKMRKEEHASVTCSSRLSICKALARL